MSYSVLKYVSDALSLITIGMCVVLKVPQISKLNETKSAVGISFISLSLELTSYSVVACYNFVNGYSYLAYLEYPVILFQEYILIYLALKYANLINTRMMVVVTGYFIVCTGFLTQTIPKKALTLLVPLCTPISASSKIAQLIAIYRAKNADSISPITWLISALSNLTRIFTIYMDSADILLLGNFVISVTLSTSIMLTVLYYKKHSNKKD